MENAVEEDEEGRSDPVVQDPSVYIGEKALKDSLVKTFCDVFLNAFHHCMMSLFISNRLF